MYDGTCFRQLILQREDIYKYKTLRTGKVGSDFVVENHRISAHETSSQERSAFQRLAFSKEEKEKKVGEITLTHNDVRYRKPLFVQLDNSWKVARTEPTVRQFHVNYRRRYDSSMSLSPTRHDHQSFQNFG